MITRFTISTLKRIINGTKIITHRDLNPTFNSETNRWKPSILSSLNQVRLRRLANIFNITIPNLDNHNCPPIRLIEERKGTLKERRMKAKKKDVETRMEKMPQILENWRIDRREQYEKSKQKLLF